MFSATLAVISGTFWLDAQPEPPQISKTESWRSFNWGKVFMSGLSKLCGLSKLNGYGLLKQKYFKDRLPRNLLSPLLNSLSQLLLKKSPCEMLTGVLAMPLLSVKDLHVLACVSLKTFHYKMGCIENPVKFLRWRVLRKQLTAKNR